MTDAEEINFTNIIIIFLALTIQRKLLPIKLIDNLFLFIFIFLTW